MKAISFALAFALLTAGATFAAKKNMTMGP